MQRQKLSRRHIMRGAAGVSAAAILHWPANAAEFSYKLGSSSPMEHPCPWRAQQKAADKIKQDSDGRMEDYTSTRTVFWAVTRRWSPQVISGALEMLNLPG